MTQMDLEHRLKHALMSTFVIWPATLYFGTQLLLHFKNISEFYIYISLATTSMSMQPSTFQTFPESEQG